MDLFIANAVAQTEAAGAPQGAGFINLLLLGGLFVFMYFMIIRPQRKKQKEHQSLVDSISKGDEVVLNSGMLGKVVDVDESYITVNAGENINLKFQKVAVHAILPKGTIKSI